MQSKQTGRGTLVAIDPKSNFVSVALTPSERRVLQRVRLGESNKEIATQLDCSVKTVEFHMSNLLRKLGVDSRLRLALSIGDPSPEPKGEPQDSA
jgi:DNA-binding NarL/FixJ family response regulator